MLVLLRPDDRWLQSTEDNWEGRMSAISKPILRAEKSIKSNQIKIAQFEERQGIITSELSDVKTKISSIERSQHRMSVQMSAIQSSLAMLAGSSHRSPSGRVPAVMGLGRARTGD